MDSTRPVEALPGASNLKTIQKSPKTLLVHPFTPGNNQNQENSEKTKNYLLETPKDLKRRQPLLELPGEFSKKPKLFKKNNESVTKTGQSEIKTGQSEIKTGQSEIKSGQIEIKSGQSEIVDDKVGNCEKSVKKCHCCCSCGGESESSCHRPVKVIITPTMMPSIFGPVPGIPYIVQQGKIDKVSVILLNC